AADAAPERAAREIVFRPDRLPGRKEFAAFAAQRGPFLEIGHARHAQGYALAFDDRDRVRETERLEERHGRSLFQAALRRNASVAAPARSRPLASPTPTKVGSPPLTSFCPAARTLSTEISSIRRSISSKGIARPKASSLLPS